MGFRIWCFWGSLGLGFRVGDVMFQKIGNPGRREEKGMCGWASQVHTQHGHKAVVKLLLEKGGDPNGKDKVRGFFVLFLLSPTLLKCCPHYSTSLYIQESVVFCFLFSHILALILFSFQKGRMDTTSCGLIERISTNSKNFA